MDIYQCMTCGERWPHGGVRENFITVAQHADETRGRPEGMHLVLVGDMDALAAQWQRARAGEAIVMPNDGNTPYVQLPPPPPPIPEHELSAFAKNLGLTDIDKVRRFIRELFVVESATPPGPVSAKDDVITGGTVDRWGPEPEAWESTNGHDRPSPVDEGIRTTDEEPAVLRTEQVVEVAPPAGLLARVDQRQRRGSASPANRGPGRSALRGGDRKRPDSRRANGARTRARRKGR